MLKAHLLHGIRKRMARLKTGQRQISDVFKMASNVAKIPLFTLSLRRPGFFRLYIPRSKCRLKISLNMKADRVLYSPHSRPFLSRADDWRVREVGFWPSETRDEDFLPSFECMQDDPLRLRFAWHTTRFDLAYGTSRPCQLYFDLTYA